jgi:hypothetical protein
MRAILLTGNFVVAAKVGVKRQVELVARLGQLQL